MKPFLKWAGGKHKLSEKITNALPTGNRLVEPFVGSGAVFLNSHYDNYLLADANADLICLFNYVKEDLSIFVEISEQLFSEEYNNENQFYKLRDEFNIIDQSIRKSAIFLYLNRYGFNGLCRYNKSGGFNVPYGRYKKPLFPLEELIAFSKKSTNAMFIHQDFLQTFNMCVNGDVVYCDPPYAPLEEELSFTSYTANGFTNFQQLRLAECAEKCQEKNIHTILSNHDTVFTRKTYSKATKIISFDVQRFIAAKASSRKKVSEILAIY
jgi:DNA adenine methylase